MNNIKWWQVGFIICALVLDGLGVGEYFLHEELQIIQNQQNQLLNQEKVDTKYGAQFDKRLSIIESKLGNNTMYEKQPHIPGSTCVCMDNISSPIKGKAEVCEFGEQCDQDAVVACEAVHKGAKCQPLY